MKIINDKYYTPVWLANKCIDTTLAIIGESNISEVVEPSVGDGAFLHNKNLFVHFAYDIEPEVKQNNCGTIVHTADFLNVEIPYLYGRLIIGNPPYGDCMTLAIKFFNKAVELGDYVAFILPISQLNNTHSLYKFDLIYSKDLGVQAYSDRKLHCCFNIYRRPESGEYNKRRVSRLQDVSIYRQDSRGYNDKEFDIRMCYWGDGCAGKILSDNEHYAAEYKIKVNNPEIKQQVIDVLCNTDWKTMVKSIAGRRIKQFHIVDLLSKNIPGIT